VLPKAPLASKASTKQEAYPHGDFEDENHIGGARSGRFKECFYQQIVSKQTTDWVPFMFRVKISRGTAGRNHAAIWKGGAKATQPRRP
jgi:hypothetical protein